MRRLAICAGGGRYATYWPQTPMYLDEIWERLKTPVRTPETMAQYHRMKSKEKEAVKDKGGFLAGTLKGTRRKRDEVVSRSMITLDFDDLNPSFFDEFDFLNPYEAIVYTTHSHTPEAPRARVLIPLTRDITPEEFNAIARYLADEMGMEMVDKCSFRINQQMYWPTVSSDGEYVCRRYKGDWLDPDAYLSEHPGWKDITSLPLAPKEKELVDRDRKKQEDPLSKKGVIGDFCRAFSPQRAMRTFLSDIYEETDDEDRWSYIPGEGAAGVVVYDDRFVYSHHATDPAGGKLLNAFDLVRTHLFDDEDPKKSMSGMLEFAAANEEVQALALEERQERAGEDFAEVPEDDGWKKRLVRQKKSTQLENSLFNIKLIMQNDPYLKHIVFNQLADGMEIIGEVPWEHPAKFWRDADDAQLICYVDDNYGTFSARNYDIAVTKTVDDRSYHPIRDYFKSLPEWDGTTRAETVLIDYLGAEDNDYVRAVTRKALCAAYMRVCHPGIKFDYIIVLNGAQGIGKSTLIARLGMEWFSDSLTLSDMNDKTAAEKLQGYWIHEIGEMAGMKKADLEKVKAFVSRQDDKYRASFGRRVTPHPRQCIFFGTTNSDNGYLRDITGNRRFWNVKVSGNGRYRPWDLDSETVQQIWAEVRVLAKAGEKLYLPPGLEDFAQEEQRSAMERDDREGLVIEYLEMLLPDGWDDMDVYRRRDYVSERDDPTRPVGRRRRTEVSNMEIWCECLGKPREDMKPADSYAISAIMARIEGWSRTDTKKRIPIYGQQRIYKRLG